MAAEKTKALILRTLEFRETSLILHLFTEEHGLIHGIAKGVRVKKNRRDFLERGFVVELVVYIKPNRDLYTTANVQVVEFFSSIRQDLIKSALRDAAFEMILSAITVTDFHPDMYDFFIKFLNHINLSSSKETHPFALWLFYHRFAQYMGFGIDLDFCMSCGAKLGDNAFLSITKGGLECEMCRKNKDSRFLISYQIRSFLNSGNPKPEILRTTLSPVISKRTTLLLSDFCRYHFETNREFKSLAFLNEMTKW